MKRTQRLLLPFLIALLLVALFSLAACNETIVKVTFVGGGATGGTAPEEMSVAVGQSIQLPANTFENEGNTFAGWKLGTQTYQPGDTYVVKDFTEFVAAWTPSTPSVTEYQLTYAAGEHGTGSAPAAVSYAEGATVTLAQADLFTAAQGYKFVGWNDGSQTYDAGAQYPMPAHAVTLTAQWEVVKYELTYAAGEHGTGNAPAAVSYAEGEQVKLAAANLFTSADYVFVGWSDGSTVYDAEAQFNMPDHAVTLTAQWRLKPAFSGYVNAVISHKAEKTEGTLSLYSDGSLSLYIANSGTGFAIIESYGGTYSLTADGVLTILTVEDAKLTLPAKGIVEGNKVTITLTNKSATGTAMDYAFESVVYKLTTKDSTQPGVSAECYYPEGFDLGIYFGQPEDKKGYEFKNYTVDGANKSVAEMQSFTMPAKDTEIVSVWEEKQTVSYKVTYKAGEGEGQDYEVTVDSADYTLLYITKTNFTRTGYKFGGWMVNGVKHSPGDKITLSGDTEITAVWNQIFKVSYANVDVSGVSTNFDAEDTYYTEFTAEMYTLPLGEKPFMGSSTYFAREGFVLKGWTSSADEGTDKAGTVYQPGTKYVLSKDTAFTAVWEKEVDLSAYDGLYYSQAGLVIESMDWAYYYARFDSATSKLTLLEGKDDEAGNAITLSFSGSTGNGISGIASVTAVLGEKQITVTVKRSNDSYEAVFTAYVETTTKTLKDYEGYWLGTISFDSCDYYMARIFDGKINFREEGDDRWYDSYDMELTADASGANLVATFKKSSSVSGVITFTDDGKFTVVFTKTGLFATTAEAEFTKAQSYTVSFELGEGYEGSDAKPESQTVISGEFATAPKTNPTWDGHKFLGWFKDGEETSFDFTKTAITEDTVLTAKWEVKTTATVTFDLNEGETGQPDPQTVTIGERATEPKPEPTREGYAFKGWTTTRYGTQTYNFETPVTDDITLYAKWVRICTVSFAENEGAQGQAPQETKVESGSQFTFPECQLTKDGMTFVGWKIGVNPSLHKANDKYIVNNDIKVTPVFGKSYSGDLDEIVLRDDNYADCMEGHWPYVQKGSVVSITVDEYDVYNVELSQATYITLDVLYGVTFTANDNVTTLTFDGKGGATLGETQCTYVLTYDGSEVYVTGFTLTVEEQQYTIALEYDEEYNLVINAKVTCGGKEIVFGNPVEEGGDEPTYTKLKDFADATYGFNSQAEAGNDLITVGSGTAADKIIRITLRYDETKGYFVIKYFTQTNKTGTDMVYVTANYTDKEMDNQAVLFKAKNYQVKFEFAFVDGKRTVTVTAATATGKAPSGAGHVWTEIE